MSDGEHHLCSSGKRTYWTEPLADRAVTTAAGRGELPPMRHYECPDCGKWHLATRTDSPLPVVEEL